MHCATQMSLHVNICAEFGRIPFSHMYMKVFTNFREVNPIIARAAAPAEFLDVLKSQRSFMPSQLH